MRAPKGSERSILIAAVVCGVVTGCAKQPALETYTPPPEDVRAQLASVAVVPRSCDAFYGVPTPVKGEGSGASAGAEQGAVWGATPGMLLCATYWGCLVGAPAALAGAIVGAIPGAVVGSAKAHSPEEVTAAEERMRQIITEMPADERLAGLIAAQASASGVAARVELADRSATPEDLAKQGFTGAVIVEVPEFQLLAKNEIFVDTPIDPTVILVIGARVRVDAPGQSDSWSRAWLYRTAGQSFFDLAANDARRLRDDIDIGLAAVATKVVTDVFAGAAAQSYVEPEGYWELPPGVARPVFSCAKVNK